jgi:hypothetical protein
MWGGPVRGMIESMNGARFVHDRLEEEGWDVLIADAAKVKGLAPLACKTDKIDARVLATLSARDLVPEIWLPDPSIRRERELARFRLHLVRHRTTLKNRIRASLIAFGKPCPVSDLFGHAGRELLARLQVPDPWRANIDWLRASRPPPPREQTGARLVPQLTQAARRWMFHHHRVRLVDLLASCGIDPFAGRRERCAVARGQTRLRPNPAGTADADADARGAHDGPSRDASSPYPMMRGACRRRAPRPSSTRPRARCRAELGDGQGGSGDVTAVVERVSAPCARARCARRGLRCRFARPRPRP